MVLVFKDQLDLELLIFNLDVITEEEGMAFLSLKTVKKIELFNIEKEPFSKIAHKANNKSLKIKESTISIEKISFLPKTI